MTAFIYLFAFVLVLWLFTSLLQLNMTSWVIGEAMSVGIIAIVILFQPELRRVLERIGQNDMWQKVFKLDPPKAEKLSDDNIEKIIAALVQMSSSSTGALICLEESISLDEFVKSGIALNSDISTQLLINIFEKNRLMIFNTQCINLRNEQKNESIRN